MAVGDTPPGTAFTYQGVLKQGGAPANGTFDFEFRLYASPAGGTTLGTVALADQIVSDGQFTVSLDFGSLVFGGNERWLEVQVEKTPLIPLQKIGAAPYALHALTAAQLPFDYDNPVSFNSAANLFTGDGAGLSNLQAGSITGGTLGSSHLGGTYGNPLTLSNDANTIAGTFNGVFIGSGDGLNDINAANITNGTLSTARLPSGGAWSLSSNLNLDSNTLVVDQANNRVGIGTTTPDIPLHLIAPNTGLTPGEGIRIQGTQSSGANLAYLSFANGAGTAIGYVGDGGGGENNVYLGAYGGDIGLINSTFGTVLTAKASGNVGIGTASPTNRLSVAGGADFAGRVGIGTTFPSSQLDVIGGPSVAAGYFRASASASFALVGDCEGSGATAVQGFSDAGIGVRGTGNTGVIGFGQSADFMAFGPGTNYGASSSARWKSNVASIGDPLAKLSQLRGVYFDWDAAQGGQHDVGMIAEEVGRVLPEIVVYEANGIDAIGMDYSKMSPLLVEAIKALRAEKDAEIARLNDRINELDRLVREALAVRPR